MSYPEEYPWKQTFLWSKDLVYDNVPKQLTDNQQQLYCKQSIQAQGRK